MVRLWCPLQRYSEATCDLLSVSGRTAQRLVGNDNDAVAYGACSLEISESELKHRAYCGYFSSADQL